MSDFSGMELSFALPAMNPAEVPLPPERAGHPRIRTRSSDVVPEEVGFRRLLAADEIQAIQRMRTEIQLPGATMADPGFVAREKKGIGKGWLVRSNGVTTSSAR